MGLKRPSSAGGLTDRSGTIAAGGTAQQVAAVNTDRRYLLVQNPSDGTESFWFSTDGTAVAASPSVEVAPGMTLVFEATFVPSQAVSVIASSTGTAFTIKEG